jgi:TPP-dependent pyruvate/acetoin dehydrogenase alpha subunit
MHERLYYSLYKIRRVEEEIAKVYPSDKIKSPVHLSIGQEATSVGVCEALRRDDVVCGYYRSHALYLAKGGNLIKMVAELYGKRTGCAGGKGGSMHLIDLECGMLGTSAIVATGIPQAVGYAYALRVKGTDRVVANFFGDGAVDEGVFHESVNFAALKKLPILFVCENNFYAINSRQTDRQPVANIRERAGMYGIKGFTVEDGNVLDIYKRAREAVEDMRREGGGPRFLECMAYRWREHVGPGEDFGVHRPRSEAEIWFGRDQVKAIGKRIALRERSEIEARVEREIREAFEMAERDPLPANDDLYTDVFKED